MTFELQDLRMVDAIAAAGTLTAAARCLGLSQPALSLRLKQLEQRLAVRLYERDGRAMRATPAGECLLETAREVLARLDAGEREIAELVHQRASRLRISTECYTTYRWLPRIALRLVQRTADLEVGIVAEATADPLRALREDRLDVAIVSHEVEQRGYTVWPLFGDELYAVCRSTDGLARHTVVEPAALQGVPLVLYMGKDHPILRLFLEPAGVTPGRITQVQLTEAIVELVRAGQGLACLSGWAFDALGETQDLVRLRLGRGGLKRTWHAVTRDEELAPHVRRFIELVRQLGPGVGRARITRGERTLAAL